MLNKEIKEAFLGKTVLITGVTGLIGSSLAKKMRILGANVVGFTRNVQIASKHIKNGIQLNEYTNGNQISFNGVVDYIVHAASPTSSLFLKEHPVEALDSIISGTKNVLDFAKGRDVKKVVYLSSMEVYGFINGYEKQTEEDLGIIDLKNPRSCYSEGKRICELMCSCYNSEYNTPVCIARLANTFGPGVSRDDKRFFMYLAKSVIDNTDIVLHTTGESTSNFTYIDDTISAILTILVKGNPCETYNVCNDDETKTIKEIAEMVVSKIAHDKIRLKYDIPKNNLYGYACETKLKMCSKKLKDLGWVPTISILEAYAKLIKDLKNEQ